MKQVVEIELPPSIPLEYSQEPDGRFLAVIPKYPGVMAYGNTQNEAAAHAIELLLNVLDERVSFAEYLASIPVEDEELKPEFAASNAGGPTTAFAEVSHISRHGLWLLVGDEEFWLPFTEYPWFQAAPISNVRNVELLHGMHLHWPDMDVDLELDALQHPEDYILRFDPKS